MSAQSSPPVTPDSPGLWDTLSGMSEAQLDALDFGVIGFGPDFVVDRYNQTEIHYTGLRREQALGTHVFTQLAQCMNNWLVAQHYEDSMSSGEPLDMTLDYTLTWRMRPTPVRLRLLRTAGKDTRSFIILQRSD